MTSHPLAPAPAAPQDAPDPVGPRLLMALGAYATPVLATATWFAAYAVTRIGPGGASDDLTWLPLLYLLAAAPPWLLAAVVGTVGVALPPPRSAGRVSLVLLVPLLVAGLVETWGFLPRWHVAGDGLRSSVPGTVLAGLGALLSVGCVVVMVVGLARSGVVGRGWWAAVVLATVTAAAVQWWWDSDRYRLGDPGDQAPYAAPTYAAPTDDLPTGQPCTAAQAATLDGVVAALPWPVVDAGPSPEAVGEACLGRSVTVAATYDQVVAGLPKALAANGVAVVRGYVDELETDFSGRDAAGVQVDLMVQQFDEDPVTTQIEVALGLSSL